MAESEAYLRVHVQPRASRNEVVGWREGALVVRLTAPPVEGAANRACQELLAEKLKLRRSEVQLVSGEKSREKRFRISGLTEAELSRRLAVLVGPEEH
jgi:uncharacterized protein (TIGR00251 family)